MEAETEALILGELRALRGEVRALLEALPRRRQREDAPSTVVPLLEAIYASCGDRSFACRDLIERAKLPRASSAETALREAIVAAVGEKQQGRRLGKLLRRIAGRTYASMRIERQGEERDGATWRVSRATNPPSPFSGAGEGRDATRVVLQGCK